MILSGLLDESSNAIEATGRHGLPRLLIGTPRSLITGGGAVNEKKQRPPLVPAVEFDEDNGTPPTRLDSGKQDNIMLSSFEANDSGVSSIFT